MSKIDLSTPCILGDYVRTQKHNLIGRVYKIEILYNENGVSDTWFEHQVTFGNAIKEDLSGRWYGVLVHEGGSVLIPERRLTKIAKFDFNNPFAETYFGKN